VKAVFLDRDGVINHDPGDYTRSVKEFHILPGFLEKAKEWYDLGYILVVITNQGGIAKGLYGASNVEAMHQYLQGKCIEADLKPGSLMVEKAIHTYKITPQDSIFFGDKDRDIVCAEGAGVKGFKIKVNSVIPSPKELNMA